MVMNIFKRKRGSVLVVDDDPSVRLALKTMFETESVENVFEAPDGETAIEIAYRHEPRLVILDYDMPRMDGEAVARVIRVMAPDAKIVLFTGVLKEPPIWADAYFQKPDLEKLLPYVTEMRD